MSFNISDRCVSPLRARVIEDVTVRGFTEKTQHPDHQLRINRGPTDLAVKWRQLAPRPVEVDKPVDRSQQMLRWHMGVRANTRRTELPTRSDVPPSSAAPQSPVPE